MLKERPFKRVALAHGKLQTWEKHGDAIFADDKIAAHIRKRNPDATAAFVDAVFELTD